MRLRGLALAFALGAVVTGGAWVMIATWAGEGANARVGADGGAVGCRTLADVLAAAPGELASMDVGEMNLLCAAGLPGAEGVDVGRCLARLDDWARHVRRETDRHLYRFRREAGEYDHSEGTFRMLMLVTVLQQDLGVHYNAKRVRDVDFRRSEDLFLHGLPAGGDGRTCVSMPVAYVAVGRRLGYPLKLVRAKAHVRPRWEGAWRTIKCAILAWFTSGQHFRAGDTPVALAGLYS